MWTYHQENGKVFAAGEKLLATGYSGNGIHKNQPNSQEKRDLGPIPRGFYKIGPPYDSELRGPHCLPLTPFPETEMFGRSAFLIHGDSMKHPGTASHGCIILPRWARERIWESGDDVLEVVA